MQICFDNWIASLEANALLQTLVGVQCSVVLESEVSDTILSILLTHSNRSFTIH